MRAARFGKEDAAQLQHQRRAVERLQGRFVARVLRAREHVERQKEVDEEIHRQIRRVAEGRVGARAALDRDRGVARNLHQRPTALHGGGKNRGVPKPIPQFVGRQERACHHKPGKEVKQAHISLHTFKVAPKTFDRVNRKECRYRHPRNESQNNPHDGGDARTVLGLLERQQHPAEERHFDQNAKSEVFARDVGEEKIRPRAPDRDDKRNKQR